jgi:hypothetical protein
MVDRVVDSLIPLKNLKVGTRIKSFNGDIWKVSKMTLLKEDTYKYKVKSGLESRSSLSHTLKTEEGWLTVQDILIMLKENEQCELITVVSNKDIVESIEYTGEDWIIKLELSSLDENTICDHTYVLDGFLTHNTVVKSQ